MADKYFTFVMEDGEKQRNVGNQIHECFVGNQDYVDCGIVLHVNDNRHEEPMYGVEIYADADVSIPTIKLELDGQTNVKLFSDGVLLAQYTDSVTINLNSDF